MENFWDVVEQQPDWAEPITELAKWSVNYDRQQYPWFLFLDLIEYSAEQIGEPLTDLNVFTLDFVGGSKLANALIVWANRPDDAHLVVQKIQAAE